MQIVKKILFIVNPISGAGKKKAIAPLIEKYFSTTETTAEIRFTEKRNHGFEIAQEEKGNFDAIIAVGGDGSVNEIGSALIGSNCALGIIPHGSGNGLARHLHIPLQTERAIARIADFNRIPIDTGTVNDIPFLGTCGFGFDAHVAKKFDTFGQRGFMSYIRLVTSEYNAYRAPYFKITGNDIAITKEAMLCSIANSSQFGNGFTISPNSDIQDGIFELVFLERFNLIAAPIVTGRFFTKSITASKHFSSISFKDQLHIEVIPSENAEEQNVYFHIDGEPKVGKNNFTIKINPKSLFIL